MSFKLVFVIDEETEMTKVEYLPKELAKELEEIFKQHDKDNTGSIEPAEIEALLATLGYNETQKEIQAVFKKIDKNFDNQISFDEFKMFIEEFILPEVADYTADMEELFKMLKMNDVFGNGTVAFNVLLAIVERFGVKLTTQEGLTLAKYLALENNEIPIYAFLHALSYPNNESIPGLAKSALYKIKYRKKISLK